VRTLVFDVETVPFSDSFRHASTMDLRRRLAPEMRVACVYCVEEDTFQFFTAEQAKVLVELLASADRLVSFNGKNFDLLVLARHYGLDLETFQRKPHDDLLEIIHDQVGYWVSLNDMSRANLGERKQVSGRQMETLDLEKLKNACRSDVWQAKRLWDLYQTGQLTIPARPTSSHFRAGADWLAEAGGGPGDHAPRQCPVCGDVASLVFVELEPDDFDDLTEGQQADYLAGLWGTIFCTTCEQFFDYEV
jgi:hypothetical protein